MYSFSQLFSFFFSSEKNDRVALWYTGVTCRVQRMYTQILGIIILQIMWISWFFWQKNIKIEWKSSGLKIGGVGVKMNLSNNLKLFSVAIVHCCTLDWERFVFKETVWALFMLFNLSNNLKLFSVAIVHCCTLDNIFF